MPRPAPAPRLSPPSAAAWLLLPLSVVADGALFWPAACLVAVSAAGARDYGAMLVWYGLALGFDHTAIVLAPFVVAVLIGARVRWPLLPLAPGFALAMLLARSHGLPPLPILPQPLALDTAAPSLWVILEALPWIGTLPLSGLALTSMIGAAAVYIAWGATQPLRHADLFDGALLCALAFAMLLPGADPDAFLLSAGLALHMAVVDRGVRRWRIAALIGIGLLVAWLGGTIAAPLGALATLTATFLHARGVFKNAAANDNAVTAWRVTLPPLPQQREM